MEKYHRHTAIPYDGGKKFSFCVMLIRHEIEYDINLKAVKLAKTMFADSSADLKKDIVLSAKQEDWLDRMIEDSISKVKSSIRFAVPRHSRMASDEILEHPIQYVIPLEFDEEWSEAPDSLCNAIHNYVVENCLADWSLTAVPSLSPTFTQMASDALTEIHDIACSYTYDMINPVL